MDGAPTLSSLYALSLQAYEEVVAGDGPPPSDAAVAKALDTVQTCLRVAAAADLYSANEELSEISTKTLRVRWLPTAAPLPSFPSSPSLAPPECALAYLSQLLALEYYLGKVHCRHGNLLTRLTHLQEAAGCFRRYLRLCVSLRVVDNDDADVDMNDIHTEDDNDSGENGDDSGERRRRVFSAEEQRSRKIARYKREKEAKDRMQALQVCRWCRLEGALVPIARAPIDTRPHTHSVCCSGAIPLGPAAAAPTTTLARPARTGRARATTGRRRRAS